ncbi:MAG: GNAT family N-acetyltransferase [Micromonosporaceae bacterium]
MEEQYRIRPITPGEFAAAYRVDEHAFHTAWPAEPEIQHFRDRFEFDRSLAAFDGDVIAGTACAFSFRLSVPGAVVPAAGVSGVAVLPPHRRRGILRGLMTRQLRDVHARGEAVAALWASEGGIYGRFGYGLASLTAAFRIRRGEGMLGRAAPADTAIRLRIAEPEAVRPELAKVYDLLLPGRPGAFARNDRWWDAALYDAGYRREGAAPLRCLLADDSAGPRGYALYCASPRWDEDGIAAGTIMIRELMADSPSAAAALWRDLLSRDLTGEVSAWNRPVDDPLLHLLADTRAIRARTRDGLWVRLVDVAAALAQRRYAAPVEVVIEVTDDICPWNNGRWRLRASGPAAPVPGAPVHGSPGQGGAVSATCEATSDPADLAMPVAALGAVYLGGTRLGALASAGLVTELRAGALAAASVAMSWDPAPWCPMIF